MRTSRLWAKALLVAGAAAALQQPLAAQAGARLDTQVMRAGSAVAPSVIQVGDVFQAAIRVNAPAGSEVVFADTLEVPDDVEGAGRREMSMDTISADVWRYTAIYPLTAWRPDTVTMPAAEVIVRLPTGGATTLSVAFERFAVQSVLPADTTGIEPRQARDVFGPNRVWWPLLLLALLLAALIALGVYLWRRKRDRVTPPVTVLESPRERALRRIDAALDAGLIEAGKMKEFYSLVAEALRGYVADLERGWGCDLTTTELRSRMRNTVQEPPVAELVSLLGRADLIKFARAGSDSESARTHCQRARTWVERFAVVPVVDMDRAA